MKTFSSRKRPGGGIITELLDMQRTGIRFGQFLGRSCLEHIQRVSSRDATVSSYRSLQFIEELFFKVEMSMGKLYPSEFVLFSPWV